MLAFVYKCGVVWQLRFAVFVPLNDASLYFNKTINNYTRDMGLYKDLTRKYIGGTHLSVKNSGYNPPMSLIIIYAN